MIWEQIQANKRKSAMLVVIVAAILFALGYFMAEAVRPDAGLLGLSIAFIIWFVLTLISYYGGDSVFLALAGARKIEKEDLPVLYNVVEEMTIASGLEKMPDIYIVDDRAPNAFATGRDPGHAAVAVTSGLLRICNRDELQGVIAHELGHVRNRDTLLMLMAGVMVGCIVILSDVGRRWLWWGGGRSRRSRGRGGGQAQAIIMLIAVVLMILAPLVAQLVYFAISRKREYLADACSALFTRYPEGLASALEKIAGSPAQLARVSKATAPMYIVNPLRREGLQAADWTSTHPPISERVRILRSMGGAAFADYNSAFGKVLGRPIIPPSALEAGAGVAKREAQAAETQKERAGKVNDFFWKLSNYMFLTCGCGTVLKVPPGFRAAQLRCPHCSRIHPATEFHKPPDNVAPTDAWKDVGS